MIYQKKMKFKIKIYVKKLILLKNLPKKLRKGQKNYMRKKLMQKRNFTKSGN